MCTNEITNIGTDIGLMKLLHEFLSDQSIPNSVLAGKSAFPVDGEGLQTALLWQNETGLKN